MEQLFRQAEQTAAKIAPAAQNRWELITAILNAWYGKEKAEQIFTPFAWIYEN